jgi:hypothetical protein
LPAYLVENPQKFPFLLPGNCTRELEAWCFSAWFHVLQFL